jgi:hypothetical protein
MAEGTIVTTMVTIPASVVIAFFIDHVYFPPAFILQEADLSLFFKPAEVEIPSYSLNFKIILPVDPFYHHIPFSFHEEPVVITAASFEVVIGFNYNPSFVITFVKIHLVILLIVLLIVSLIIALIVLLIVSLIKLPVVPLARLCLCNS